MYNEIEQLEKSLIKRKPAETLDLAAIDVTGDPPQRKLDYSEQKKIFELPMATQFSDPEVKRILPGSSGASEKIVGGKDPDFSGYDDLLNKLNDLKPRDTSTQDLINMGISTGIGLLGGRFGTGAKVAGNYGMDRFNKAEKRAQTLDDMILKLQADRAAKMAAGKKGQKVKTGAATDPYGKAYQNRYLDKDGIMRTPQFINDKGQWVKDEQDPVYNIPNIGTLDQKQPDGTVVQQAQMGNQVKQIGGLMPQLKTEKTAKGEMALINDRTGKSQDLGDFFNKTGAGLSPHSDTAYKSIADKKTSDPLLRGLEGSYNDMSLGMSALGRGDIAGALAATKMAASALEKGRMTSDKDLAQVSNVNLGLSAKMESLLMGFMEGGKITEPGRRELESLFSQIEANSRDAHQRRVGMFNKQAQTMLGKEWRPDLAFDTLPKFTGRKQEALIDTSMKTAKDVMSTGEWTQPLVINGKPVMRDGKPVKAVYIMKNGKPFAIREGK